MPLLGDIEKGLIAAIRLIGKISPAALSRQADRVRIEQAIQSLRHIFFFSSELLFSLEQVSEGKEIDPELARLYRDWFRHVDEEIFHALEYLRNDLFEQSSLLSVEDIDFMQQVRYGKINTRRAVFEFFDSYLRAHQAGSRNEIARHSEGAARVLGQIQRFNQSIKKLERKLQRARGNT